MRRFCSQVDTRESRHDVGLHRAPTRESSFVDGSCRSVWQELLRRCSPSGGRTGRRRREPGEREHADACPAERKQQLAHITLLRLKAAPMFRSSSLAPRGAAARTDLQGACIVGGAQTVTAPPWRRRSASAPSSTTSHGQRLPRGRMVSASRQLMAERNTVISSSANAGSGRACRASRPGPGPSPARRGSTGAAGAAAPRRSPSAGACRASSRGPCAWHGAELDDLQHLLDAPGRIVAVQSHPAARGSSSSHVR